MHMELVIYIVKVTVRRLMQTKGIQYKIGSGQPIIRIEKEER